MSTPTTRAAHHASAVDERIAVVASGLVLPRLAAFGPPLRLSAVKANPYVGNPVLSFTWSRVGQMFIAMAIGLFVLVAPMSALAYAADSIAGVTEQIHQQQVPGERTTPVIPEENRLTPASIVTDESRP